MNILKNLYMSKALKNYTGIVEYIDGTKYWYLNGLCHRLDGPAIEFMNGNKYWFLDGRCHRENGPAVEFNGDRYWYLNGELHRVDGPAVEYHNGYKMWYLNGIEYIQEEWFERLSDEDKLKAIWNLR
jgi:hypothetical protein